MGKLFKWLGLGLAAVVVLAAVAAGAFALLFDPTDLKPRLEAEVEKYTGRELVLAGDLGLSFYPWLGFELGSAELGNAPGFGEQPFARVQRVAVRVKLLPLFSRRLEADVIELRGLQLNLARNAEGQGNWEDLAAAGGGQQSPGQAAGGTDPGADQSPGLAGLAVAGLEISEARVSWRDAAAGQALTLADLNLETGALATDGPIKLEGGFRLEGEEPAVSGPVDLSLAGDLSLAQGRLDLKQGRLSAELSGPPLPPAGLPLGLSAAGTVNWASGQLDLPELTITVAEAVLNAQIAGQGLADQPRFEGQLQVPATDLRALLERLAGSAPATADPEVLRRFQLASSFAAGSDGLTLSGLVAELDDTRLEGRAALSNPAAPRYRADLEVDRLDLDRYLPPPPAAGEAPAEEPEQGAGGGLPMEPLRSLNLDARLRVGELKASGLTARQVELKLKGQDGVLSLEPLAAQLYGGSARLNASLDARGEAPALRLVPQLTGIAAGPLLEDLRGSAPILGTGDFSADLRAQGSDPDALQRSLDGELQFAFRDGAINGFNIARALRQVKARLDGEPAPDDGPDQTDFSELTGSAQVADGLVDNQDLYMKSPLLRVTGAGQVDLPQQALDYRVKTVIVGSLEGQGGKDLEELQGIPIPVHIKGPFADPKVRPDLANALSETAKARVEEKVEERKQEIVDEIKEEAGKKLLDLFGGGG